MWRSARGVKMTSMKDHSGLLAPRHDLMRLRTASAGTPLEGSARYSCWPADFAHRGICARLTLRSTALAMSSGRVMLNCSHIFENNNSNRIESYSASGPHRGFNPPFCVLQPLL